MARIGEQYLIMCDPNGDANYLLTCPLRAGSFLPLKNAHNYTLVQPGSLGQKLHVQEDMTWLIPSVSR